MPLVIGPRFIVRDIEPADVRTAPPAQRKAFWNAASAFVAMAKEIELRNGLDKDGDPMAGLAKYTIEHRRSEMGPADPHAPPLQPAHGLSRTRSLFRAAPTTRLNGVVCWWAYDPVTAESWGKMLAIHKAGGPHLPPRDVIGLSKESVAEVKKKAAAWWAAYTKAAGAVPVPTFEPEIEPTPAPRFTYERVPKYAPKYPERAIPKEPYRISQIKINGRIYTMQSGTAAGVQRGIANKTFTGFRRVLPLPEGGPEAFAARARGPVSGTEHLKRSATAEPIKPRVTLYGKPAEIRAELRTEAPRVRVAHLADLVGATAEARVEALVMSKGGVFVKAAARDYETRIVLKDRAMTITHIEVPAARQGKGIGREIITQMIAAAERAQLERITLMAARGPDQAGYKVWPRYGFDGPLPAAIRAKLPAALKGAKTVADLYKTAAGRAWWEKHGATIELSLEL